MSENRLRPFFLPPSTGDQLLANATRAVLTIDRWGGEPLEEGSDLPEVELSYELKGSLPTTAGSAALIRDLLREFNTPRRSRRKHDTDRRSDAAGEDGAA